MATPKKIQDTIPRIYFNKYGTKIPLTVKTGALDALRKKLLKGQTNVSKDDK